MIVLPEARDELLNGLNVGRPYVLEKPRAAYALAIDTAIDGRAPEPASRLRGFVPGLGQRLKGLRA